MFGTTPRPVPACSEMHWTERFVAAAARDEDCADFVVRVVRQQFGRRVALPQHAAGLRGADRQIAALSGVAWVRAETPRDGDLAVMRATGRQRSLGHHLGVWCSVGGVPHVLHRLERLGAALHRVADLPAVGLELADVCRWA